MERYKDKDGKWAWKFDDKVVVRQNDKPEVVKEKVVKVKPKKSKK